MADRNSSTPLLLNGQAAAYIAQGLYDDADTVLQESMDKVGSCSSQLYCRVDKPTRIEENESSDALSKVAHGHDQICS